ncbi:hypothetical protein HDU78_006428 [Chytriomyces hyalinus]|nr:hypothetical protein HDU78_006428 [Chytriomyces hyalinus]
MSNPFGTSCGVLQITFNTCLSNQLTAPSGISYTSAETYCQPFSANQAQWYACLCTQSAKVVDCFAAACSSDPNMGSAKNAKDNYCSAATAYSPTTTAMSPLETFVSSKEQAAMTSTQGTGPMASLPASIPDAGASTSLNAKGGSLSTGLEVMVGLLAGALFF